VLNAWKTDFIYDGRGRLRKRIEYTWNSMFSTWSTSSETRYIYDGMRVIQERNSGNTPTVSYTRGSDLSGSMEGAGGIGGLLSRSHAYQSGSGSFTNNNYYHADGGGNVTMLIDTNQTSVATYKYDPYGNSLGTSGSLAGANVYRFSSKELISWGFYYYGYRFYDPNLQRWPNRDPLGEKADRNLYRCLRNNPFSYFDPYGLDLIGFPGLEPPPPTPTPGNPVPQCAPYPACLHDRPRPKDPQAGLTCWGYAWAAESRNFPGVSNPPGGGYRHCVAACCLTRGWGPDLASAIIWVWDKTHENPRVPDSQRDMAAERRGRQLACGNRSCEEECLNAYP